MTLYMLYMSNYQERYVDFIVRKLGSFHNRTVQLLCFSVIIDINLLTMLMNILLLFYSCIHYLLIYCEWQFKLIVNLNAFKTTIWIHSFILVLIITHIHYSTYRESKVIVQISILSFQWKYPFWGILNSNKCFF